MQCAHATRSTRLEIQHEIELNFLIFYWSNARWRRRARQQDEKWMSIFDLNFTIASGWVGWRVTTTTIFWIAQHDYLKRLQKKVAHFCVVSASLTWTWRNILLVSATKLCYVPLSTREKKKSCEFCWNSKLLENDVGSWDLIEARGELLKLRTCYWQKSQFVLIKYLNIWRWNFFCSTCINFQPQLIICETQFSIFIFFISTCQWYHVWMRPSVSRSDVSSED